MTTHDPRHDGSTEDSTTDGGTARTITRRRTLALAGAAAVGVAGFGGSAVLGSAQEDDDARTFTVRIENVSDGETLSTTADGEAASQPVPLSPGAYAVHSPDEPIFSAGAPERDNGLEEVAEDGMPGKLAESLAGRDTVVDSGAFATPVDADGPAPLTPGAAYEFETTARAGRPALRLSLVTMFVPSNDAFYALGGATGMPLFRSGNGDGNGSGGGMAPVAGDVTDSVGLWDAGTEVNEEPGVGDNQVQRQRGANVGLVERGTVVPMSEVNGYDYPATSDVIRVRVTPSG